MNDSCANRFDFFKVTELEEQVSFLSYQRVIRDNSIETWQILFSCKLKYCCQCPNSS